MASETKTIRSTCLCGDAAHDITLPSDAFPLPTYFCTCNSCRHLTGTLFLSTAFLPPTYQPSSALLDKLTSFKFSDRITQYFCKRCGSTMLCYCLPKPTSSSYPTGNWDVMTGTLEAFDTILDLKGYEYIHDTRDGGFADFMPTLNNRLLDRWSHDPNTSPQLPLHWRHPSISMPSKEPLKSPTTRLQAHCKCTAITFHIARPSPQSALATRAWPDLLPHHSQTSSSDKALEPWHLRASQTKFLAGLCSCTSCRLASGQELTAWAFIPLIDISLDAEGTIPLELSSVTGTSASTSPSTSEAITSKITSNLKTYASSPAVTRSFCSVCGAIVFFHLSEQDQTPATTLLDVAIGLLSAPEGARAENWLEWWTERLSFREDAVGRRGRVVEGVEGGLREFGRKESVRREAESSKDVE